MSRTALLIIITLLAGCASLSRLVPPEVTLSNLELIDATLFEQRFRVALRVTNPNDRPLRLQGASAAIEINGMDFATGVTSAATDIDAFGDGIVELTATTNIARLWRQVTAMSERRALDYRLTGSLRLAGSPGSLRIDEAGEIAFADFAGWGSAAGLLPATPAQ